MASISYPGADRKLPMPRAAAQAGQDALPVPAAAPSMMANLRRHGPQSVVSKCQSALIDQAGAPIGRMAARGQFASDGGSSKEIRPVPCGVATSLRYGAPWCGMSGVLEMAEHHHTCLSGDAGERNERDHDCSREVAPEPPERTTDERLSATGRERWRNDRDRYDPCLKLETWP